MTKHQPFKEVEAARPDFNADINPTFTKTPNPDFKPGQGLNDLPSAGTFGASEKGWKAIIPENEAGADVYKMMISAITPRPIAFVSSLGDNGKANLAPMSYFNAVSHDPPTIMVSIAAGTRSDGFKAANYTSIDAPPEVDEWALSGLTQRKSETVSPPHVAESAFSMECEVSHWHDLIGSSGKTTGSVILGRVKRFQVREFVLDPGDPMKVRTEQLRPISRLGGISYGRTTQMLELPRPVWEHVQDTSEVKEALEQGTNKQDE
ncbi:hypothetical protein IAR50_000595 [Cryptococcus sp. DSM 104548]